MRKLIAVILVTIITVMAASAELKTVRTQEYCGETFGHVHFTYEFDDEIDGHNINVSNYNKVVSIFLDLVKDEPNVYVQKEVLYTKGCEYAKVYGYCLFQSSLGIEEVIILQPNGYYTVISSK